MNQPGPGARVPTREALAYGTGALGTSVTVSMFMFFFSFYLTDVVGLAPIAVMVLQLLRNGWNAVSDPLVGHLTDRARTRFGRRKPFIALGAVPFALFFALLWQVPRGLGAGWTVLVLAGLVVLYDAAQSMVSVPYSALTPAMTQSYDERTRLNGFRQAFSMVGGLLVGGSVEWALGAFGSPARGFSTMAWVFAAVAAGSVLPVLLGTKERHAAAPVASTGVLAMFRQTLSNRAFVVALAVYLFSWVAVGVCSTMVIYFFTHVMKMADSITLVLLTVQLAALASIPALVWASARWGKRATFIGATVFWVFVQLAGMTLGPEDSTLALCLMACVGVGVGAAHVLPWSMVPDCIELDELQTGERREGAYYGVMSFVEKIGSGLALGGVGLVLQLHGYEGGGAVQGASAQWALRLLMGPLPAALLTLALVAAWFFPLTKARYAEVCRQLAARRSAPVTAPAPLPLHTANPLPSLGGFPVASTQ